MVAAVPVVVIDEKKKKSETRNGYIIYMDMRMFFRTYV